MSHDSDGNLKSSLLHQPHAGASPAPAKRPCGAGGFKKTSPSLRAPQSPELADRPVEIWFQDEASMRHSKALRALDPLAHSARAGKPRHLGRARHAAAHPARPAVYLGEAGQRFRQAKPVGMAAEGCLRHLSLSKTARRAAPAW